MRALEIPPTTAPSSPPAIASWVAELPVSGVVVVVVSPTDTGTDWVEVVRAEAVEAGVETVEVVEEVEVVEVRVGLTSVFPPDGRLTSVLTSLVVEVELTELL